MDTDPDCLPPPPAYSEQEFDQKIAQATDLSLIASNSIDPHGWERYDPAAFGAPPASPNVVNLPSSTPSKAGFFDHHHVQTGHGNPTSVLPTIVPLRIEKKSQLGREPYYNSAADRPGNMSPLPLAAQRSQSQEAYNDSPNRLSYLPQGAMPPYSPAAVSQHRSSVSSVNGLQGSEEFQSQRPLSDAYWPAPRRPSAQYPLPVTPDKRTVVQESGRVQGQYSSDVPLVPFDPTIAYGNSTPNSPRPSNEPGSPAAKVQYDPHALYNSAVSAQMNPLRFSQSGPNQIPPNSQYHNTSPNTPMRSVYPTNTFNSDPSARFSQHVPTNYPRQSISWQTSSGPTSHYTAPNTHNFASTTDTHRYSQYSNG